MFALRALSLSDFSDSVDTSYRLVAGDHQLELVLAQAAELPPSPRAAGAFRLEFRGPTQPLLEQATYRFHQGDAIFDIFIVPVARDAGGALYEAVFT